MRHLEITETENEYVTCDENTMRIYVKEKLVSRKVKDTPDYYVYTESFKLDSVRDILEYIKAQGEKKEMKEYSIASDSVYEYLRIIKYCKKRSNEEIKLCKIKKYVQLKSEKNEITAIQGDMITRFSMEYVPSIKRRELIDNRLVYIATSEEIIKAVIPIIAQGPYTLIKRREIKEEYEEYREIVRDIVRMVQYKKNMIGDISKEIDTYIRQRKYNSELVCGIMTDLLVNMRLLWDIYDLSVNKVRIIREIENIWR